jgi:outer membrane protein
MNKRTPMRALAAAIIFGAMCSGAWAQAQSLDNTVKLGYAAIRFNGQSSDLAGPPGSTPPGAQVDPVNTKTLALAYERRLNQAWSIVAQAGTPPITTLTGRGSAAPLGDILTARAWFPALLGQYSFNHLPGVKPYIGIGANYTAFTDGRVSASYTTTFGGSGSTTSLKSGWGTVVKLGAEIPLAERWVIDLSYSRYSIRTTATIKTITPGLGNIERKIDVKADPEVFSVLVGYRF